MPAASLSVGSFTGGLLVEFAGARAAFSTAAVFAVGAAGLVGWARASAGDVA